jgi:HK97 family phage major capsid protein
MSNQLRAEFKSALAEAQQIRDAEDRTDDQSARFRELVDTVLPGLETRLKAHQEVSSTSLDHYADMAVKSHGTPFTPSRQVGQATFNEDGFHDEGEGVVPPAQLKAVSTPEYSKAFKTYMRLGEDKVKNRYPSVYKTLVAGLDDYAGILIPPDVLDTMIKRTPAPTVIAGRVRRYTTGSNRLIMLRETYRDPSGLDIRTSPITGMWTGEGGNPDASPEAGFGEVTIPVHEYMGKLSVTNTLLEDAGFNLESYISEKLNEWLDYHYESTLINGTGVGQPLGIWTNAGKPQGLGQMGFVETAAAGVVEPDLIKSMEYNILPQYQGDAVWIMNQRTAKTISLMKDDQKQYLFQKGELPHNTVVNANPKLLAGYPVLISQYLPDIATGKCPIFFGSLKGVYMVQRLGMTVRVLNEIEALKNRRVYLFRLRWGAMPVEDQYGKFVKIK